MEVVDCLNDNEMFPNTHKTQDVTISPQYLDNDDKPIASCLKTNTPNVLDQNIYCTGYDIKTKVNHGLDWNSDWFGRTQEDSAQIHATKIPQKDTYRESAF